MCRVGERKGVMQGQTPGEGWGPWGSRGRTRPSPPQWSESVQSTREITNVVGGERSPNELGGGGWGKSPTKKQTVQEGGGKKEVIRPRWDFRVPQEGKRKKGRMVWKVDRDRNTLPRLPPSIWGTKAISSQGDTPPHRRLRKGERLIRIRKSCRDSLPASDQFQGRTHTPLHYLECVVGSTHFDVADQPCDNSTTSQERSYAYPLT